MNLLEITLHEATISHSRIDLSYTISDMDSITDVSKQQIGKSEVIKFICEKELNVYCSDVVLGEYAEMDGEKYLVENLNEVVVDYLMDNLS